MVFFLQVSQLKPYMHHSPPHSCHMPRTSVWSRFSVQSPVTNTFCSPNISLSTPLSNTLSPCLRVLWQSRFQTHTKEDANPWFCAFQFSCFWIANWQTEGSWPNGSRQAVCSVCSSDWFVSLKHVRYWMLQCKPTQAHTQLCFDTPTAACSILTEVCAFVGPVVTIES
jgi:hypothetical protein